MYRNLNDYEILYMVNDNNDAFDILYQKYQPLIKKIIKEYEIQFKKFGYEKEDLMQIGYLTLYKASYLYNNYYSSKFYTYFSNALKKALLYEMKSNSTYKKETLNNALSYDLEIPNSNNTFIELIQAKENKNDFDNVNLLINFKNYLSFDLGGIFELYYNGYNIKEISVLLDKNLGEIKKGLQEIKRQGLTFKYLFLNKNMIN